MTREEMDTITLHDEAFHDVRALGADVTAPPEVLARVRAQVVAPKAAARRGRLGRWALGAVAAVALTVAGTLTINNVMYAPSAAAQEVMGKAALAARTAKDQQVGPNQYRKLTINEDGVLWGREENKSFFAFETSTPSTMYIPGDARKEWVWVRSTRKTGKVLIGTLPAREAASATQPGTAQTVRGVNGNFYGVTEKGNWQVPDDTFMASLPRDPKQLHDRLVRDASGVGSFAGPQDEAFTLAADLLRSWLAPADLRASVFEAIGQLRGVSVFDETTVNGRKVIPVGFVSDARGERRELIFDASTFDFVGEQTVLTRKLDELPVGTARARTSVTIDVVDSAP